MALRIAASDEAVEEPAIGLIVLARAVGLREVGVKAEQDAADAEGDGIVKNLRERDGRDGDRGMRQVADHDGVDDSHEHPSDLGQDKRQGEGQDGTDLAAEVDHGGG